MARPTKMTPETIDKLRQAFLIGATKEEASGYAGISKVTLYNYIEKHPEFLNEIEKWQNEPILKAKTTVVKNLSDTKNAQWYLERKANDFKPKADINLSVDPAKELLKKYDLIDEGEDVAEVDSP